MAKRVRMCFFNSDYVSHKLSVLQRLHGGGPQPVQRQEAGPGRRSCSRFPVYKGVLRLIICGGCLHASIRQSTPSGCLQITFQPLTTLLVRSHWQPNCMQCVHCKCVHCSKTH
jgi:hypothetical protein